MKCSMLQRTYTGPTGVHVGKIHEFMGWTARRADVSLRLGEEDNKVKCWRAFPFSPVFISSYINDGPGLREPRGTGPQKSQETHDIMHMYMHMQDRLMRTAVRVQVRNTCTGTGAHNIVIVCIRIIVHVCAMCIYKTNFGGVVAVSDDP